MHGLRIEKSFVITSFTLLTLTLFHSSLVEGAETETSTERADAHTAANELVELPETTERLEPKEQPQPGAQLDGLEPKLEEEQQKMRPEPRPQPVPELLEKENEIKAGPEQEKQQQQSGLRPEDSAPQSTTEQPEKLKPNEPKPEQESPEQLNEVEESTEQPKQEETETETEPEPEPDTTKAPEPADKEPPEEPLETSYAVIVDCGSSGTRAHIFSWPSNTLRADLPGKVKPMLDSASGKPLRKNISPGLSSVSDNPEQASDYMKPIMDFISEHIPKRAQATTPVYFMATAGLRLLSPRKQEAILDDIARDLKREYNFPHLYTKVISGTNEGLYLWLSVNAHADRLTEDYNQTNKNFYCTSPRQRRYGVLEMGGASAQVAFELSPSEIETFTSMYLRPFAEARQAFDEAQVRIELGESNRGQGVKLFSATFLGFGSNSARQLAVDLLVRDAMLLQSRFMSTSAFGFAPLFYSSSSTFVVEDPCLPSGAQQVIRKPAELLFNKSRTVGFYVRNSATPGETFNVRLIGRGNYLTCQALLRRVLYTAKQERLNCDTDHKKPCSVALLGTNFVPWLYLQFLGLSEFYYTTKEILDSAGTFNTFKVTTKTAQICSTPYQQLEAKYPEANRVDSKRILLECFKANWLLVWLQNGLRMVYSDLTTVDSINSNPVDWTFGAAIRKLLKYPGGHQSSASSATN